LVRPFAKRVKPVVRSSRLGFPFFWEASSWYTTLMCAFVPSSVGIEFPTEAHCVFFYVETLDAHIQLNEVAKMHEMYASILIQIFHFSQQIFLYFLLHQALVHFSNLVIK